MARERSNKNRGVQFTHESAKAIADVVRQSSDAGRGAPGMGTGWNPQSSSHYLSRTSSAWSVGTSQTLTIWSGTPGSETSQASQTVEAWNYVANLPSGLRIVVARANGSFYLASFDFTGLSGYSASSQQILAHNTSGQLVWLNTTACT